MQDQEHHGDRQARRETSDLVPVKHAELVAQPLRYRSESDREDDDLAQTLRFHLRTVLSNKWLISTVTVLALAIGAAYSFMQTPLFQASARIQIDAVAIQVVERGGTDTANRGHRDYLATQFELLKSRAMAVRVASALALHSDKQFFAPRNITLVGMARKALTGTQGTPAPTTDQLQSRAARILQANLIIRPVRGSRLVDIIYRDPSPARAQNIANAYADAYLASNIDKRFQANAYAKTFLEDQIQQLKLRLEASEKTLLEFSEREQIVRVSAKGSIAESNLAAANAALGALVSERIKNEQLWRQVEQNPDGNLPQLLSNKVIEALRGQRKQLARDYEERLETFKPGYPAMIQIQNKIGEIDRQIASETQTIRQTLRAHYEASLGQERDMKTRVAALRTEVLDLQKRSVQHSILKREVDSNRNLYDSLLQRYKEVDVASGVGATNAFIVDRALKPGAPFSPRLGRALLVSLALGFGGGLGLAYLREILDDKLHLPAHVEKASGLATLGVIPRPNRPAAFEYALDDPFSGVSEAYRSLATALQFSTRAGLPRTLAVTSAAAGEGKSSTALALARHFATTGLKVLLIDADLRKPALHARLGHDNAKGLCDYLTGSVTPPEVINATDLPNLAFMPTGPRPANANELLTGAAFQSLLRVGTEVFDLIVVDTPPLLGLADAQLIASANEATVFVVASGEHGKGTIRGALNRLQLARSHVIGTVVTKYDTTAAGYGYEYGYGYGDEPFRSSLDHHVPGRHAVANNVSLNQRA